MTSDPRSDPIDRDGLRPAFWRRALTDLTQKEWEALCDGCGKCCLNKLEDKETGEAYWAYNEIQEKDVVFSGETYMDASMFVDVSRLPNVRISSWAVLYGHQLGHGRRMFAVLDKKEKTKSIGSLEQMASRNRFSTKLKSIVSSSIDVDARFPGADPSSGEENSDGENNSILDSVLGKLTGG